MVTTSSRYAGRKGTKRSTSVDQPVLHGEAGNIALLESLVVGHQHRAVGERSACDQQVKIGKRPTTGLQSHPSRTVVFNHSVVER